MLYGRLQSGQSGFPWVTRDVPQLTLLANYNMKQLHGIATESESLGMTLQLRNGYSLPTFRFRMDDTGALDTRCGQVYTCLSSAQGAEQMQWYLQDLNDGTFDGDNSCNVSRVDQVVKLFPP